ncbi:hypothetical protein [Nostoc sp.]
MFAENVRGVVLPGGHQLAEECPQEVAREYFNFFGEMTGVASATSKKHE